MVPTRRAIVATPEAQARDAFLEARAQWRRSSVTSAEEWGCAPSVERLTDWHAMQAAWLVWVLASLRAWVLRR